MINAYDFDGTIYDGDSSVDFYFFCLKKNKKVLKQLPIQLFGAILYLFRIIDKTSFKEKVFSFLKQIDNVDSYVEEFWKTHKKNIYPWYLKQKKETDVIISASPEFLLKPLEKKFKFEVIASKVDKKTGKFLRKNCHDYEKITRYEEKSSKKIKKFYSDSIKSDRPMLEYADEAYLIKKGQVYEITDQLNKKNIILSSKYKKLVKLLLLISWPILGLFMTITDNSKIILINSLIIFAVVILLLPKIKIETINKKKLLIATLLACYTDKLFLTLFSTRIYKFQDLLVNRTNIESIRFVFYTFVAIAIFPTILFCIYWFIEKLLPNIVKEIKTINKLEKRFLIIVLIVASILSIGTSLVTSAFQVPTHDNQMQYYDIIYTSDNGYISNFDSWANFENGENDIRQPLFALFALPISIPCHIASELLFFVPSSFAYLTLMSIVQYLLLAITTILISRMIKIREQDKKYLFLLFSLSFPYVLFGLVLEQYTVSLFYVIATMYYYFKNREKVNYLYLGAVGTLVTSGILFPAITKFKDFKNWFKKAMYLLATFIVLLILSGQFAQIFTLPEKLKTINEYIGVKLSFSDKFVQFTHFVKSLFLSPNGKIGPNVFGFDSYQLTAVKTISIIGIIVLVMTIVSFILNRKDKMALISFCWVIFSFIILVLVGWGSVENSQILYSLYFSWAYYILYFLLLSKIKNRKVFKVLIILSIIIMFIPIIVEMSNIIKFGIRYYPR